MRSASELNPASHKCGWECSNERRRSLLTILSLRLTLLVICDIFATYTSLDAATQSKLHFLFKLFKKSMCLCCINPKSSLPWRVTMSWVTLVNCTVSTYFKVKFLIRVEYHVLRIPIYKPQGQSANSNFDRSACTR